MELPIEAYDLALYFESTYICRHLTDTPIVIPSIFSLELWNNHFMVHFGLPRTTNVVEAWHRSFSTHMSCHHPSLWKFLSVLKKEQGLTEVKQAFYLCGKNPSKRKSNADHERALETLVEDYLTRPKMDFLRGVAYQFAFNS